jgi:N-acetylglucosamine-6-phosphate deacetylase
MDRAVRNVMEFARWDLKKALRLATLNPSRVAALTGRGEVKPGARADLVVLSPTGEVRNTIIGGEVGE